MGKIVYLSFIARSNRLIILKVIEKCVPIKWEMVGTHFYVGELYVSGGSGYGYFAWVS